MSDGSVRKPVHETPFAEVPAGNRKAARARTVVVGSCIFGWGSGCIGFEDEETVEKRRVVII